MASRSRRLGVCRKRVIFAPISHVGGKAVPGEVDDADRAITAAVAPLLKREGIVFAGLDVIAGKLIEINVTSPTLAQELKRFSGLDLPKAFWDRVEAMV